MRAMVPYGAQWLSKLLREWRSFGKGFRRFESVYGLVRQVLGTVRRRRSLKL